MSAFQYGVAYQGVVTSGAWLSNSPVTSIPIGKNIQTVQYAPPAYCNMQTNLGKIYVYLDGFGVVPDGPLTLTFVAPSAFVVPGNFWFIYNDDVSPRLLYDVSNTEVIDGQCVVTNSYDDSYSLNVFNSDDSVIYFTGTLDQFTSLCTIDNIDFHYATTYKGIAISSDTLEFTYMNPLQYPVRTYNDDDGPQTLNTLTSHGNKLRVVFNPSNNFGLGGKYSYAFIAPIAFDLDSNQYILADGTALAFSFTVPSAPTHLSGLCTINYAPVKWTINSNGFVTLDGTVPRYATHTETFLSSTVSQPINTDVYCQFDRSDNLDNGYINSADNLTTAWAYNASAPGIYLQRVSPNIISNTYLSIQFSKNSNVGMDLCGIGIVNSSNISGDPKTRRDVLIYLTVTGDLYINGELTDNIIQNFKLNDSVLLNMDIQNNYYVFYGSENGSSRSYETGSFSGSDLYAFVSFQGVVSGPSFTIQYPSLYTPNELSGARMIPYQYPGLYPDIGTLYLTTPTAIGVRWPDKTVASNYTVQTINTNCGRVVGNEEVSGGSFLYKNNLEPESQYNMMIQYVGDVISHPLLSGIDTAALGKNLEFVITNYNNIAVSLHDITKVPSPWMICVTSLQIDHPIDLPIINYRLTCSEIGFVQSFKYQGKSFEFVSPTTNSTLGTSITHDFSKLSDPNNLVFTLTYDTPYASNLSFDAKDIKYFNITLFIYTYQLFLYGIN